MTLRGLIGLLALVVLGLLAWELRWVLLVLFGAVVLAVALDVPVSWLRRFTPMNRPQALAVVVLRVRGQRRRTTRCTRTRFSSAPPRPTRLRW